MIPRASPSLRIRPANILRALCCKPINQRRQRSSPERQRHHRKGQGSRGEGRKLVNAPVGFLKGEGRLEKDPDRRVQEAVRLVFSKFLELGTARQTLLWFLEHGLQLPVCNAREELQWRRPSYATIYRMLTNPAYGGAYAYGKSEQATHYADGEPLWSAKT